eukprot:1460634-Amphidinium_carterae.1
MAVKRLILVLAAWPGFGCRRPNPSPSLASGASGGFTWATVSGRGGNQTCYSRLVFHKGDLQPSQESVQAKVREVSDEVKPLTGGDVP